MSNKTLGFIISIIIFIVVAAGGIMHLESERASGTEVILATEPIDPRSLFRGDYVILRYKITGSEKTSEFLQENYRRDDMSSDEIYFILELDTDNRVKDFTPVLERPK